MGRRLIEWWRRGTRRVTVIGDQGSDVEQVAREVAAEIGIAITLVSRGGRLTADARATYEIDAPRRQIRRFRREVRRRCPHAGTPWWYPPY